MLRRQVTRELRRCVHIWRVVENWAWRHDLALLAQLSRPLGLHHNRLPTHHEPLTIKPARTQTTGPNDTHISCEPGRPSEPSDRPIIPDIRVVRSAAEVLAGEGANAP